MLGIYVNFNIHKNIISPEFVSSASPWQLGKPPNKYNISGLGPVCGHVPLVHFLACASVPLDIIYSLEAR